MLSAILIFVAIFCVFIWLLDFYNKRNKTKKVHILEIVLATWFVIGGFLLNSAFIGQGISEISDTDKYIDLGEGYGVHQTEDGQYYRIKNNWWTFWDMYDREYITETQVEEMRVNKDKIKIH